LDISDLFVLSLLGEGKCLNNIAEELDLTPSAITAKKKRYAELWPEFGFLRIKKIGSPYVINEFSKKICMKASEALKVLRGD